MKIDFNVEPDRVNMAKIVLSQNGLCNGYFCNNGVKKCGLMEECFGRASDDVNGKLRLEISRNVLLEEFVGEL